jgi:hypothetical protein
VKVDLVAGSVTDSQMGQDYIEQQFGVPAANVRRNGKRLFEIVAERMASKVQSTAKVCLQEAQSGLAIPRSG